MKSLIDPGNTLRLLRTSNDNHGLVTVGEEQDYQFQHTPKDAFGNTSRYHFTARDRKQSIEPLNHREKYFFAWGKTSYLQEPRLNLVIPKGMLYDNVPPQYQVKAGSGAVASAYQLNDKPVPLHVSCELRIGLWREPVADTTKYCMARVTLKGTEYSVGRKYEDGFMKVSIRELGTYTVALDTVPPETMPANKNLWGQNGKTVYRPEDEGAGIVSYREAADGKYTLFGCPNIIKSCWECALGPKHVKKGGKHIVEMTVMGVCGNQTVSKETFIWQAIKVYYI